MSELGRTTKSQMIDKAAIITKRQPTAKLMVLLETPKKNYAPKETHKLNKDTSTNIDHRIIYTFCP